MRAPERPHPSPLSSATVAIGAARHLLRRYRVGPVLVILAAAILVIGAMRHAETTTASALSRWQATVEVWTTTGPVDAGETIEPGAVRPILLPADLVPVGAVATDPRGLRTRIELGTGEIVVERWLTDTGSTLAARTPEGWRTISIGRRDDLFTVGDLVDLHHAVDGSPPTRSSSWPPTPTSGGPYLPTSWAMWSEHRGRPGLFRYSAADQRQPVVRISRTATPTTMR